MAIFLFYSFLEHSARQRRTKRQKTPTNKTPAMFTASLSDFDVIFLGHENDKQSLTLTVTINLLSVCNVTFSFLHSPAFSFKKFLSRATRPTSHRVGRSVRLSVGPSVPLYFFGVFELFEGRIARVLVPYGCLCPCPNHFCPCPTDCCPCPTARDRGSRVYGLVSSYSCLLMESMQASRYKGNEGKKRLKDRKGYDVVRILCIGRSVCSLRSPHPRPLHLSFPYEL